jgi:hypothetical protein
MFELISTQLWRLKKVHLAGTRSVKPAPVWKIVTNLEIRTMGKTPDTRSRRQLHDRHQK